MSPFSLLRPLLLLACLLLPASLLSGEETVAPVASDSTVRGGDSTGTVTRTDTSAAADTAAAPRDSIRIPEPDSLMRSLGKLAGQDSSRFGIEYSGERITFLPRRNVVLIRRQANVESGARTVSTDSLIAYNRSTGEVFVGGRPTLTDGPDELTGEGARYNMDSDRGVISEGETEFAGWFLHSESLGKVGQDSIFGRANRFTTCDLEQARHFHFESRRIKVIRNKMAFASPVVLKIGKVPVFALPFVFFPITTGNRRSGILQPRIGVNSVVRDQITGRTLGNLGYFWAPNDYVDFLGAVDIRTGSQTTLRGRTRYRKRYSYDGNLDIRRITDKINDRTDLSIFGRHDQTLGERARLNAEINYTSSRNLLQRTAFDQQDLLRQSLRSTASFSWRPSWGSFASSARHEKFLDQGRTVALLPSLRLSLNRRNMFEYLSRTVPRRHGLISSGWLYNLTYGLSTDYSNTRTTEDDTTRTVHRSNSRLELATPQTLYGWLKLTPSLSYSTELTHRNFESYSTERGLEHQQVLNTSVSMSTQIFGFFDGPRLGPIFRWRHTVRPRLSYNFQPDLTGEPGGRKVSRASFSIVNDLDYKYFASGASGKQQQEDGRDARAGGAAGAQAAGQDRAGEKEGKLVSVRNSLDYDFVRAAKRDTLGWGSLSTSITSSPTSFMNVQLLMNHDIIEPGRVEHFKPFMRSLSTTVTFRGTYQARGEDEPTAAELDEQAYEESMRYPNRMRSAFDPPDRDYMDRRDLAFSRAMPWSVNLSHNLSRTRGGDRATQSLRWSFTFNPTPGWHLVYRSSYNFSSRGLQGQSFTLNRDLHCWQANLSLVTLSNGRFEFVFSTFLKNNPAIRVPDVRRASN